MNTEKRVSLNVEVRVAETDGKPTLTGYAAKFNVRSQDLGGFVEMIRPGTFARAIREKHDVRALINHDPNLVLGRSTSGTLSMVEDATGLLVNITPPETRYAEDLVKLIKRGDVSQMSFAFKTLTDEWRMEEGKPLRELMDLNLYDVSAVTYPAYNDATIAARSLASWQESQKPSGVQKFLTRNEARQKLALMR